MNNISLEHGQMLREIRQEYCKECHTCSEYNNGKWALTSENNVCDDFRLYLEDLFAEAENQTEPKGE